MRRGVRPVEDVGMHSAIDSAPTPAFADLMEAVAPVADCFGAAGCRLYLVGGVVRDRLLGVDRTPDYDLTTDATPDVIRDIVANVADAMWLQGERFGTIGVRVGNTNMEITTHRAEAYLSDSRKPVVRYTTVLYDDLARRDFTVNAMAVDVTDGSLHDPFGGRADLVDRVLRTPLDPRDSFSDDPLRMLRAARFLALYSLTAAEGLVDAARSLVGRMDIVSVERIRDELFRLLEIEDPSRGFDLLDVMGLLPVILPDLIGFSLYERGRVVSLLKEAPNDPIVRLAILAQLAGGSQAFPKLSSSLRLSGRDADRAQILLEGSDRISVLGDEPTDANIRRLAGFCGKRLDDVLVFAELLGRSTTSLVKGVKRLRAAGELDDLGPALDGATVMEILGVGPGPAVGEAMVWLAELRVEEGLLPLEETRRRLIDWWESTTA
ncbi:MAG TPA: CCA tRNA nucleotidyltransferase [Acidimicrobiaceae bacterium]|nr:CCA tRNA nucleotidyltransferase [Acidimicrobiaceae bacterium]